ncbi:hypothetical protein ABRP59_09665 [Pectobacterium punjabense]|uniref:hypothetical protein n=1 Tax=Pectobacterium punjabense TaxID=2108399 RepID=UPI0032ED5CB0
MSIDLIYPVSSYCLSVVLDSYKQLAPRGRLLATIEAQAERDTLLLAWAMSNEVYEIAQYSLGRISGIRHRKILETQVCFGQTTGSIVAHETLQQQHLTTDSSLFVINELVPCNKSQMMHYVVAQVLKLARDEILKSLQSDQIYDKRPLEERLSTQQSALAMPALKGAISVTRRRLLLRDIVTRFANRSIAGLHSKAANSLRVYEGLRYLAPFALRRILADTLFDRIGNQRLLELASGLALAEALSIACGHPLVWNSSIAADGIIAKIGPFAVGWHEPIDFNAAEKQSMVSTNDTRTGSCLSFIKCANSPGPTFENEAIRLATESLVAACRQESNKGPRFEETPLVNCAVVMRHLFNFAQKTSTTDKMVITEFDKMTSGRFLELAHRVCRRAKLD